MPQNLKTAAQLFEKALRPTFEDMANYAEGMNKSLRDIGVSPRDHVLRGCKDIADSWAFKDPAGEYEHAGVRVLLNCRLQEGDPTSSFAAYTGTLIKLYIYKDLREKEPRTSISFSVNPNTLMDLSLDTETPRTPQSSPIIHAGYDQGYYLNEQKVDLGWDERETLVEPLVKALVTYSSPAVRSILLPPLPQARPNLKAVARTLTGKKGHQPG